MKGEWKVISNYVMGVGDIYYVGRILDTLKPFHSGNVEYLEGHFNSKEEAQAKADELNKKENEESKYCYIVKYQEINYDDSSSERKIKFNTLKEADEAMCLMEDEMTIAGQHRYFNIYYYKEEKTKTDEPTLLKG